MISSRSASEADPEPHAADPALPSNTTDPLPQVDSDDKPSAYLPPPEHLKYFLHSISDATQSLMAAIDAPQGPISLSDTSIPRSPRLSDSAPPMTIAQFKEWAAQTGVEMLLIADLSLWKSRKTWRHEFIVVTLDPCPTFEPRGLDSRLGSFPLVESIKGGLRFRIDRGQRKGAYGSHRSAVDTVELMNPSVELEECDLCFSLRPRTGLYDHGKDDFAEIVRVFTYPRVFDILFCLDRALAAFGAEYNLIHRNCWHFASFVFQTMVLLFGDFFDYNEVYTKGHKNAIRKQFYGAKFHRSVVDFQLSSFGLDIMYGTQMDRDLPLHKNPFRSALFVVYAGCLGCLNGYPDMWMLNNGVRISILIKYTILSQELVYNGTASFLGELLKKHLSKCDCHGLALNNGMAAMAATFACLSMLIRDMDNVGIASANVEFCVRYIQSHDLGDIRVRTTFAHSLFNLVNSRESHSPGVLSAVVLDFFIQPSDDEQIIAFRTIRIIAMREPHALQATDGLGSAIKKCFAKLLLGPSRALFVWFVEILISPSLSQMFVEWGLLEDMLDFLKKTDRTWERNTATIPSANTTASRTLGSLMPAIRSSVLYIFSFWQTPRRMERFMKAALEGGKVLKDFTAAPNRVTYHWGSSAKPASLAVLLVLTMHAMKNCTEFQSLVEHTNEGDGGEPLGTQGFALLASSSSQGHRRERWRAQKGRARTARANEGAEPPGGIDHAGANKGNQMLETCEGPAPLISSGTRSGWQAMRRNQTGKGHISQTSEGTNLIRDMPYNGSGRAKRIRRLWD